MHALCHCAQRVEFPGAFGAADQRRGDAPGGQLSLQRVDRLLAGADYHMVDFEQLRPALVQDMQPRIVDALVAHAAEHEYATARALPSRVASRRVCIEPMTMRFFSVSGPACSGSNKRG